MPSGYLPIFLFLLIAILFLVAVLVVAKLVKPATPNLTKHEAYESRIQAASNSRSRYTVQFSTIPILFAIFDAETVFLYPWAVRYRQLGWFGVAEVAVFLAILVDGYVWA